MNSVLRRVGLLLFWIGVVTAAACNNRQSDSTQTTNSTPTHIEIIRYESGSSDDTNSIDALRARLGGLEWNWRNLKNVPTPVSTDNQCESCDTNFKMILEHFNSIDARLKKLQSTLDELQPMECNQDTRDENSQEIIATILSGNFKLAEEKLNKSKNTKFTTKIIRELFSNSEDNFGIILNFTRAASNWELRFSILKTLYDEMRSIGHKCPLRFIELHQAFGFSLMEQDNKIIPNRVKQDISKIISGISKSIRKTAPDYLIKAMKTGDFESNLEYSIFVSALQKLPQNVSDEVIKIVVKDAYGEIDSNLLCSYIFAKFNVPLAIEGASQLFWKIKQDAASNNDILVKLISNLAELQRRVEFAALISTKNEVFERMLKEIPTSARNLYFSPVVCLWNKGRQAYLEAAPAKYNHDQDRRNIFITSQNRTDLSAARWTVIHQNDEILFRSHLYSQELLYAARIDFSPEMHYVFSWIPGNNLDGQSAFNIELRDDDCYIKSVFFNEYLFAPLIKYDKDDEYSRVLTRKIGGPDGKAEFEWEIRVC